MTETRTTGTPLLTSYGPGLPLSDAQRRFAQRRDAFAGIRAGADRRSVFMYCEAGSRTYRWLVDPSGRVMEFVVLQRDVRPLPTRFVRIDAANGIDYSLSIAGQPPQWRLRQQPPPADPSSPSAA